ncbi:ATP-binding protein [Vibrio splendidus]|uniref:HD domain-containing protein n=1 Tax=Vibrio splendidus TaxID=29497 RepID=UPI00352E027D
MSLLIPQNFSEKLTLNLDKRSLVTNCTQNVTPWLTPNNAIFFPEYTDHGFTHLNEVLLSSDGLITDIAKQYLTSEDAAAIVISTILHDCAMHMTIDGFYTLISGKYSPIRSRFLEPEPPWPQLWESFIEEARKFSSKQLLAMFGNSTPIRPIPEDKLELTEKDKLLIGEFIRRHHARIAHEIALNGIPGVDGTCIALFHNTEDSLFMDLCGFIARSHNMGLREAVDCLEEPKKRQHLKVHVPFVMLVLRIADYIQIHSERAEKQLLNIKALVSPISQGEWKKHHAIVEIIHAHDDPEAIFIDAEPQDAVTYTSLKRLFKDIQAEIDKSWSVLGETYGRYSEFSNLGINIRRIRSSLDDEQKYIASKSPNFIPKLMEFRTASMEMLDLLVTPLYGDNPDVGIRELLQNSVDACKELKDCEVKQLVSKSQETDQADISLTLYINQDGTGRFEIKDRGIGMTLDVVDNYFLNIGASFRNSDYWKSNHVNNGHSTVHRTGRFGIGLLAAYLLGDKLKVTTRHVLQPIDKGLTFECSRNSTNIVVDHITCDSGTTISIELSESTVSELNRYSNKWDWYVHSDIKVERRVINLHPNIVRDLSQRLDLPKCNDELDKDWHRTCHPDFDDIIWRFKNHNHDRGLYCNGIRITSYSSIRSLSISPFIEVICPKGPELVVFDQDGHLPLNLERTGLDGNKVPFLKELEQDMSKSFVNSFIELLSKYQDGITRELVEDCVYPNIKGLTSGIRTYHSEIDVSTFVLSKNKVVPFDISCLENIKPRSIVIDASLNLEAGAWNTPGLLDSSEYYLPIVCNTQGKGKRSGWIRNFFEIEGAYGSNMEELPICGRRILISKTEAQRLVGTSYVPKTFWNKLFKEWENDSWVMYSLGAVETFNEDLTLITQHFEQTKQFAFIQHFYDWDSFEMDLKTDELSTPFYDAWINKVNHSYLSMN